MLPIDAAQVSINYAKALILSEESRIVRWP